MPRTGLNLELLTFLYALLASLTGLTAGDSAMPRETVVASAEVTAAAVAVLADAQMSAIKSHHVHLLPALPAMAANRFSAMDLAAMARPGAGVRLRMLVRAHE